MEEKKEEKTGGEEETEGKKGERERCTVEKVKKVKEGDSGGREKQKKKNVRRDHWAGEAGRVDWCLPWTSEMQ